MIRLIIPVLIFIAVIWLIVRFIVWAKKVDLKIGIHRMPTQREAAFLAAIAQALRMFFRLLLRR